MLLFFSPQETIRQRLLEIKKTRVKRGQAGVEREILEAFESRAEGFGEEARRKEEEERALMDK